MDKMNVFSEPSDIISILVYTESFSCDSQSILYFNNANLLKSIRQDYLWVDKLLGEKLLKAGMTEKDFYMRSEELNLIKIRNFLNYLQTTTKNIVNQFLVLISNEIFQKCEHYSISEMLHFPSEPYVL